MYFRSKLSTRSHCYYAGVQSLSVNNPSDLQTIPAMACAQYAFPVRSLRAFSIDLLTLRGQIFRVVVMGGHH